MRTRVVLLTVLVAAIGVALFSGSAAASPADSQQAVQGVSVSDVDQEPFDIGADEGGDDKDLVSDDGYEIGDDDEMDYDDNDGCDIGPDYPGGGNQPPGSQPSDDPFQS